MAEDVLFEFLHMEIVNLMYDSSATNDEQVNIVLTDSLHVDNRGRSGLIPGPARPEKTRPSRPKKRPGPAGAVHVSLMTRSKIRPGPARPGQCRPDGRRLPGG